MNKAYSMHEEDKNCIKYSVAKRQREKRILKLISISLHFLKHLMND